ncbi:hypothetical protein GCM10011578_004610 [Streptomyces fuscichromogenes]|uniref:Uncharacterized protein n=1 Tax=Streptomyces fuscichromogenes TaxID=1324013 RepID=A0A917UG51_9ACTN|nr:hypothetical protein GCM10011578_004610 [Streptomyces fuscichromogenes]
MTVREYRAGRRAGLADACAGAAAAPAIATPAPVAADFSRNFRRFKGMF